METPDARRWYAEKFADAAAVAAHGAKEFARLSTKTRLFRDTWYGTEEGKDRGTLPHWLLERSLWTFSTLTTNGTYRLAGGRLWGWEGTGCCHGTCTHVWHYGQSAGRLFPQAEIDLRERTDFADEAFQPDGLIRFRGAYSGARHACIDGQSGILLRCYREHLGDPSGGFLKRNWAKIKKATEFLVKAEAEGKPGGNDGIFNKRFEHAAAALMVSLAENEKDPLLEHGLAVCRAVHDRYDASRRNPYNEIECSDHYARTMASYGVFIAATGFHCDAAKGLVRFDPKIRPDDFAAPFTGAGAWGRFEQKREGAKMTATLEVRHGAMKLATLELRPSQTVKACNAMVGGKPVAAKVAMRGETAVVSLDVAATLAEGETLLLALA